MKKIEDIIEVLKALGDPTRYKILELLASCGNNLCVTGISKKLEISQPVISQHLKVLKNAKVVSADRAGYHIHYSINLNIITDLVEQLNSLKEISLGKCSKEDCMLKD